MNPLFVLTLVSLAMLGGAAANDAKNMLANLCGKTPKSLQVTRLSQVQGIIDLLNAGEDLGCSEVAKDAILKLEPVLGLTNVCSEEAADVLADFWKDYVKRGSRIREQMPNPLRQFFLAFVLQASKKCKITLMSELQKATDAAEISPVDLKIVAEPMMENIHKVFGKKVRFENLLIMIEARRRELIAKEMTTVDVQPAQKRYFEMINSRCATTFRPVYKALIAPIVRYAAMGANYKAKKFAEEFSDFQQQDLFKQWIAAVFSCEAVKRVVPVVIAKTTKDAEGNTKQVTVLDEDDLELLKMKSGLEVIDDTEPEYKEGPEYQVSAGVDDLVLDGNDKHLSKAVSSYDTTLNEVRIMQMRVMRYAPSIMELYVKQKMVKFGVESSADDKKLKKYGSRGPAIAFAILAYGGAIALAIVLAHGVILTHGVLTAGLIVALVFMVICFVFGVILTMAARG